MKLTMPMREPSIAAVGGFHGAHVATEEPDSPHLDLGSARAAFVYGHADQDPTMTRHALQENITRQASRDQMLLAQHVTKIVHCFAEDVYQPERLIAKLDQAGVPRLPQPRALPF